MPPAGRPRSGVNRDLPPGLLRRSRRGKTLYYYQHRNGYQEPLGSDFEEAKKQAHRLAEQPPAHDPLNFAAVSEQFERYGMTTLSAKTKHEYRLGLVRLVKVFGTAQLEQIQPQHVGKLLHELRETPHQANRLKALLSRLWNWSRMRGFTSTANPCIGIDGFTEPRREVKVSPADFWAVHDAGDQVLRDWLRLGLLSGARVTDPLRLRRTDVVIEEDKRWLAVRSTKTGTQGRMEVTGDLAEFLDELLTRPRAISGPWLIQDDKGQRVTYPMLRNRFDAARKASGVAFQMRDLRKASLNQAETLEEARRRALHKDPRTTARHYELMIEARPARLPKRKEER